MRHKIALILCFILIVLIPNSLHAELNHDDAAISGFLTIIVEQSEVLLHDDGFDNQFRTKVEKRIVATYDCDNGIVTLHEHYGFNPPVPNVYKNSYSFMFGSDEYGIPIQSVTVSNDFLITCSDNKSCISHKRCKGSDTCRPSFLSEGIANTENTIADFQDADIPPQRRDELASAIQSLQRHQATCSVEHYK